jgi:hypothetical protein
MGMWLNLFGGAFKEALMNDTDFLTSGLEAQKEAYRTQRMLCRIITVLLIVVCGIVLLTR